jgi:Tfp pilus assembly protein PilF
LYGRGNAWGSKGYHDRAIADYSDAIRLNPEDADAYINRGTAWLAKRAYDRALGDYDEALRLNPKDSTGFSNRGSTWHLKGDDDRVIADYNEAIRLNPKDACALYNRGIAWSSKGDNDRAIVDYSAAIHNDPNYAAAFLNRGNSWSEKGDNDRAIADYSEAIRLNPKVAVFYYSRGGAWHEKGEYERAIADFDAAVRLPARFVLGQHLGLHRLGFAVPRINPDERLSVGVTNAVAAWTLSRQGGGKRRPFLAIVSAYRAQRRGSQKPNRVRVGGLLPLLKEIDASECRILPRMVFLNGRVDDDLTTDGVFGFDRGDHCHACGPGIGGLQQVTQ